MRLTSGKILFFLFIGLFSVSLSAAPKTMIVLSSHTYDSGDDSAKAVTVNNDNIFVTDVEYVAHEFSFFCVILKLEIGIQFLFKWPTFEAGEAETLERAAC